ncbi:MAG: DNA polymerase III subunit epsilon [Hyphomicrobiaceae bacterium]|nr:DNA polymerase III subunit epsilon [Hyphomicrobiaceae bacterium]
MREIVLDTETTGLDPGSGDRVVEIGCVELVNHIPSGQEWHAYLDPERNMPAEAYAVHNLSEEFLTGKPLFADVFEDFLEFVADDRLIIHNASFDVGFLNAELERVGGTRILMDRVTDTLALARRKHPGSPNSLDALCKRYGVDASSRTTHGALIDCNLLAAVYIELIGGHQAHLELATRSRVETVGKTSVTAVQQRPSPLPSRLTDAEKDAHRSFVATLGAEAFWKTVIDDSSSSGTP